jgi:transcriptional regulator with XRE-family HTH domain
MDATIASYPDSTENAGMTPETCRAARALIGLSQAELAERAGVMPLTVRNYETGKSEPSHKTWRALKAALERGGVQFIDENGGGSGVRWKKPGK